MTDMTSGIDVGTVDHFVRGLCPLCGRARHRGRYRRRKSARRKALLRDATDPNSSLSPRARAFILKRDGNRVPYGYEVSHETPLYTLPLAERCRLDSPQNMKTQRKSEHRPRHRRCGDQFHRHPLPTRTKN